MRTRSSFTSVAVLVVLVGCLSCGGGGGGSSQSGSEAAPSAQVALSWRSDDPSVAGYIVHWGTASRSYTHDVDVSKPTADAQDVVTVALAIPVDVSSSTYFFAITSYDGAGGSSAFSNELSVDVAALE